MSRSSGVGMLLKPSLPTILAPTDWRRIHNQIFIEEGLTKVEPDGMSEEEKVDEVVSHLMRLLDKQKNIEDRMKKIEEAIEKKEPQE